MAISWPQCAELLRILCFYRGNLRRADDRRCGEPGRAEIRYFYITRPSAVLGAGDHYQP